MIFQKAIQEKRIILTFDWDFGEIVALTPNAQTSIILFRLRNTRTPFVISRLEVVLDDLGEKLAEGMVVIVEEGRYRMRRLPIGK